MSVNDCGSLRDRAPTSTPALKIRELAYDDYDQVAALQIAYNRPAKSYEEWEHQWANNPAYLSFGNAWPKGWVVEREDSKVVGYLGNIPLFYEFGGQRLLTAAARAWVVDADYRPYSLALLDLYFSQKKVDLFLNATVGPAGHDSFSVFHSPRVPAGDWGHSAFAITNRQGFWAAWLAEKAMPLAKPLSYGLAGALAITQALSFRSLPRNSAGETFQLCKNIDARFDVFWERLRKNNPNLLLAVRTREALEWHFKYPLRDGQVWILTAGTGPITAYAIFLRYDNPAAALTRMRLIDYQALDGTTALLAPMLAWCLEKCRRENIHMFESIGFRPEKMEVIHKLCPYKRKLPCWMYFYKAADKTLAEKLADPNAWDPSQFDSDASL
jgi:hypothetical protein